MITKAMELLFCSKVVTQSLTESSELIVEISSPLIFSEVKKLKIIVLMLNSPSLFTIPRLPAFKTLEASSS